MSEAVAEKRPTPKAIDRLVEEYAEVQRWAAEAAADAKAKADDAGVLKAQLVEMVETWGVRHAEKSKRLHGDRHKATTTTANVVNVDDAAVEKFRVYLGGVELPEVMPKFFAERVTYQLVKGPHDVLRTLDLPGRIRSRMAKLLDGCFTVRTKAPSLNVDVAEAA